MRCIYGNLAALLAAHRDLDQARAEVERLENQPELPFPPVVTSTAPPPGPLGHVRVLREASGTFPARSVATADLAPNGGVYAKITRPDWTRIATNIESYQTALVWLDATLAAGALH